jgi:hypothetical protein
MNIGSAIDWTICITDTEKVYLYKWLRCQNYIVELSHTIYSYECINVIYILYVNLVKLSFDPLTININ